MRVICEQHRNGVPDDYVTEIPPLEGEKFKRRWPSETGQREDAMLTLQRKLEGAKYHGWEVKRMGASEFHAWKEYADGDGTVERPSRKDRYFRIVP